MRNVAQIKINPDIELDEERIKKMPENIKQSLLITITMAMERYNCGWRDLTWRIWFSDGQPIISVKKK